MARKAAYWVEFQREAIEKGLARVIPEYDVIEALGPIPILVRWKTRKKIILEGKVIKEYWREDWGTVEYRPGQVLRQEWRKATDWEIEEWKDLSEEQLKELGVFRKDGEFSIQIVEKIEDLPAAIRQLGRHIPARKIARPRKKFVLAGKAKLLGNYAARLNKLLQGFLEARKPTPQLMEESSRELGQISQLLERSRTSFKRKALGELKLAKEGKFWETQARTSQAIADLLNQRAEDYEIATSSIRAAEKLRDLMAEIERRFRNCYYRLGQRGEQLQKLLASGQTLGSKELRPIAKEGQGIWRHLTENVPKFNPYHERIQSPEFQRLARILLHAEEDRAETVFNDLEEAITKLEAVAIGERVTRAELLKEKETLF